MPAKSKKSTKKASGSSPLLSSFGAENYVLDSLLQVMQKTRNNLRGDFRWSIWAWYRRPGALRRPQSAASPCNRGSNLRQTCCRFREHYVGAKKTVTTTVPLKMAQEFASIEAVLAWLREADVTKVASSASEEVAAGGKQLLPCELMYGSDGKQLKPLQLTMPQFMFANIKILGPFLSSSPSEAQKYLRYLKFLAVKGTRFHWLRIFLPKIIVPLNCARSFPRGQMWRIWVRNTSSLLSPLASTTRTG